MAGSEPVLLSCIESTSLLIDQLRKAFGGLETHRGASLKCKLQWEKLQEHFSSIESSLKKRFDELEKKEKEFEAKAAKTHEPLKQREAAVAAKQQASLDRLQVLKDSAVAEIEEACSKYRKAPSPKSADTSANSECKVNSYSNGEPNAPLSGTEENLPDSPSGSAPAETAEVEPRPQLKQLCEDMDATGLLNFISENRKVLSAIREEVPVVLKSAINPAQLVLDSLEGFYPPGQTTPPGDKMDGALLGLRRSCILMLNDGNAKELAALRASMKCIEEHKLETEYPLDPLQKRVAQLDKAKADKKRMSETAKLQAKRSRVVPTLAAMDIGWA